MPHNLPAALDELKTLQAQFSYLLGSLAPFSAVMQGIDSGVRQADGTPMPDDAPCLVFENGNIVVTWGMVRGVVKAWNDGLSYAAPLFNPADGVNWRTLLAKYMDHVGQCEGANFVDKVNERGWGSDVVFSEAEAAALRTIDASM